MPGTGTIINCAAVVAGGILGLLLKKGLPERFQNILICVCGLSTLFMGISGTLKEMFTIENGMLQTHGTLMIIFSLVFGALCGELLNIEKRIEDLGEWLKVKSGGSGDPRFMDGFLSTSFTICIGAMAVVGSIQDGLNGDFTTLTAKAILDFIIVVVMTSSMGKGCIFSAIPVGIFQGSITLLARFIEPILNTASISNMSMVGSMLIFCVGVNLMFHQKIKVANLLPALVFAVAAAFLPWF